MRYSDRIQSNVVPKDSKLYAAIVEAKEVATNAFGKAVEDMTGHKLDTSKKDLWAHFVRNALGCVTTTLELLELRGEQRTQPILSLLHRYCTMDKETDAILSKVLGSPDIAVAVMNSYMDTVSKKPRNRQESQSYYEKHYPEAYAECPDLDEAEAVITKYLTVTAATAAIEKLEILGIKEIPSEPRLR